MLAKLVMKRSDKKTEEECLQMLKTEAIKQGHSKIHEFEKTAEYYSLLVS